MKRNAREFRRLNITQRTALWSWSITLLTLAIFAIAILPPQKQVLRENLESKALGIAISLGDAIAEAATHLDVANIGHQCHQRIRGNPAIDYLVISKSNGPAIIAERHGWRTEPALPALATPDSRVPTTSLGPSPILKQRAFHYGHPFDSPGVEGGWIHVGLSLKSYDLNLRSIYQRTGLIVVACILISLIASSYYARRLVQPIINLHGVVRQVADGDLTVRVDGQWWGLVGLDDCHSNRVWSDADRDSLRAADIQSSLVEASRLAGKAEVATSVLHNVGNVLNSVGVSATLISDRLRISKAPKLCRAVAFLHQHRIHPGEFLADDPKGKVLPDYLAAVANHIRQDHADMLAELQELNQNIEHIKKIVAMQQTYAKVSGSSETVDPSELMEDAVRINIDSFSRHGILILRQYEPALPTLNLERHKALQILVNLLRNAKQALTASPNSPRQIVLSLHTQVSNHVAFVIRDNGVGIAHENLTSIFRHGFTTKKKGHGFGLHSSANAAREMYGRLSAHSNGPGTGAEFTLELPIPSPSLSSSSP